MVSTGDGLLQICRGGREGAPGLIASRASHFDQEFRFQNLVPHGIPSQSSRTIARALRDRCSSNVVHHSASYDHTGLLTNVNKRLGSSRRSKRRGRKKSATIDPRRTFDQPLNEERERQNWRQATLGIRSARQLGESCSRVFHAESRLLLMTCSRPRPSGRAHITSQ